jgi:fructose-1,6-bisphosphatase/inositol monophosphatase family enzyme
MDYRTHIITMLEDASQIARDRLGRVSSKTKSGDNQQMVTETDLEIGTAIIEAIRRITSSMKRQASLIIIALHLGD